MIKARINGLDCIVYYDERVPAEKAPPGYPYMYHIRHDEDDWTQPVNLERFVLVNFFGTVFMKVLIEIDDSGYVEIDSFTWDARMVVIRLRREIFEEMFSQP